MVHFNKISSRQRQFQINHFYRFFFVNLEIGTSRITVRVHTTPHLNYQNILQSIYLMKSPNCMKLLKFIYSEKATKFCEIFPLLLTVCTVFKSRGKILQNFVAFSKYMNFNGTCLLYILILGFDICHMNLYCNFRSNSNVTVKTHMKEGVPKSAPSFGRPYGYKESKIWYLLKKNYGCILLQINVFYCF